MPLSSHYNLSYKPLVWGHCFAIATRILETTHIEVQSDVVTALSNGTKRSNNGTEAQLD